MLAGAAASARGSPASCGGGQVAADSATLRLACMRHPIAAQKVPHRPPNGRARCRHRSFIIIGQIKNFDHCSLDSPRAIQPFKYPPIPTHLPLHSHLSPPSCVPPANPSKAMVPMAPPTAPPTATRASLASSRTTTPILLTRAHTSP